MGSVSVSLANDLRRALDPIELALDAGITPDPWQADALRSSASKQLWLCSRQSGKSTTAAIKGLHVAVYDAPALVILISPSQDQSNELLKKTRSVHEALRDAPLLISDRRNTLEFQNGSQILSLPGSEITARGYSRAKLIVVDEAAHVPDSVIAAVRPTRAITRGRFLALSTPAGKRGWFWTAWDQGQGYRRVVIKATQCPRIDPDFLAEERHDMGEFYYRQEYECAWLEPQDSLFDHEVIDRALSTEVEPLWSLQL